MRIVDLLFILFLSRLWLLFLEPNPPKNRAFHLHTCGKIAAPCEIAHCAAFTAALVSLLWPSKTRPPLETRGKTNSHCQTLTLQKTTLPAASPHYWRHKSLVAGNNPYSVHHCNDTSLFFICLHTVYKIKADERASRIKQFIFIGFFNQTSIKQLHIRFVWHLEMRSAAASAPLSTPLF